MAKAKVEEVTLELAWKIIADWMEELYKAARDQQAREKGNNALPTLEQMQFFNQLGAPIREIRTVLGLPAPEDFWVN